MSATLKHVLLPADLHRELRIAAALSDPREDMQDIAARGVAAEVRRLLKKHNAAPVPNEPKRSPSRVAELSPSSVVKAADEAPTSSSLGGDETRLSASSMTVKEVPTASEREA